MLLSKKPFHTCLAAFSLTTSLEPELHYGNCYMGCVLLVTAVHCLHQHAQLIDFLAVSQVWIFTFQVHIQQGCHAASQVDYHCHVPELVWLLVILSAAL